MELLDTGLRSATAALALLAALMLLRDGRHSLSGWFGAAFALGITAYLACSSPLFRLDAGWWWHLVVIACIAVPALFWLFARSLFDDAMRLTPWQVLPLLLLEAIGFARITGLLPAETPGFAIAGTLAKLLALVLILHVLAIAWAGRRGDLVPARRRFRLLFVGAVGVYMLVVLAAELSVAEAEIPASWRAANAACILLLTGGLLAYLAQLRPTVLQAPADRTAATARPDGMSSGTDRRAVEQAQVRAGADRALLDRLQVLMATEEVWREEGLTIAGLAAHAQVPEYRLRQAINRDLGYRNFPAYLNDWRIAAARGALADPARAATPVLTIALDLGYGSIGPFNRAFKERTGVTPTAFRQAALHADS